MLLDAEEGTITLHEGERFDASVMRVNTPHEQIYSNIRTNIRRQLPQVMPYDEQSTPICIVGSGWSLNDPAIYEELRQLYFDGAKIVALNGSAKWLMERNLRPSMHVMLDARPENREFITAPIPHCKTFLSSQCHPSVFDAAADREVFIFHCFVEEADGEPKILDEFYGKRKWARVPACGTVGVTSILLSRVIGFRFQHLFGMDSCYKPDGTHHAFPQALNDGEGKAIFRVGKEGRLFLCSPWQAAQARSFLNMIQLNNELIELSVHGDGLLAYLLQRAATMPDDPEA